MQGTNIIEDVQVVKYKYSTNQTLKSHNVRVNEVIYLENCNNSILQLHFSMLTRGITIYNSRNTTLRNSLLCDMTYPTILSSSDPSGLPAIIDLYFSSFQLFQSTFEKSSMSSIKAFASSISVQSSASFHNNTAIAGPAFILVEDSNISIAENSQMYFSNNHARDIGGVFYISTKLHHYTHHSTIANNYIASQTICFLVVEGNRLYTQLSFVNNTAGKGGDVIYGGDLD